MANVDQLDENGLQIKSLSVLVNDLETEFKDIYGDDINLDSNSPLGQQINIFAQGGADVRELITEVFNSYDPDVATGTVLNARCAINNVPRNSGVFTQVKIVIITSAIVQLQGLDNDYDNINGTGYTVSDDSGNQFILITTITLSIGTTTCLFRSKDAGVVEVTANTITNPVTIISGVKSVNNPSTATQTGTAEQTDVELRLKREQSPSKENRQFVDGLKADLINLDDVTDAAVELNNTKTTDSNGIPAKTIWVMVNGGSDTDIADVIYSHLSYGCEMKGNVKIDLTSSSGQTIPIYFDRPVSETLYIKFTLKAIKTGVTFDTDNIKAYIAENLSYTMGEYADSATIASVCLSAINSVSSNGIPLDVLISTDNSTWTNYLDTSVLNGQWSVSASNITISTGSNT
jgi:uncharacterized phage protein gp47/JayE